MDRLDDAWGNYMSRHSQIFNDAMPRIIQNHETADAISKLLLNALLLLNGGGLAAIPALKAILKDDSVKLESLALSGVLFFSGLICALISGIVAVWNFRMLAESAETVRNWQLQENTERFRGGSDYVPSAELEAARIAAEEVGAKSIWWSFHIGWGIGIVSALLFLVGGATLGGAFNPICKALGALCFTAL